MDRLSKLLVLLFALAIIVAPVYSLNVGEGSTSGEGEVEAEAEAEAEGEAEGEAVVEGEGGEGDLLNLPDITAPTVSPSTAPVLKPDDTATKAADEADKLRKDEAILKNAINDEEPAQVAEDGTVTVQAKAGPNTDHSDPYGLVNLGEKFGPATWHAEDCKPADDNKQSPINIICDKTKKRKHDFKLTLPEKKEVKLFNNGHTIDVSYDSDANGLEWKGYFGKSKFSLESFVFRSPSDHMVDGKFYPLEIQFKYSVNPPEDDEGVKDPENEGASDSETGEAFIEEGDTQRTFLSVFAKIGEKNEEFQKILDKCPRDPSEVPALAELDLDLKKLFPSDHSRWTYEGSLTTPPCSEEINWIVMKNPIEVSSEQIAEYNEMYKGTNRPVQPLNGRKVASE